MRLNKFLAENTELSRRKADTAIDNGRIKINGNIAKLGDTVSDQDEVSVDGNTVTVLDKKSITILLNKPVGYVCSKDGQGAKTVYDLLPESYKSLNIAGRLDKDSSGLVILTNDGNLLNDLTHPSNNKEKIYEVGTNRELYSSELIDLKNGVDIGDDRLSKFKEINNTGQKLYSVVLEEGRNRQIRRAFEAIDVEVISLNREKIGKYKLGGIKPKEYIII